VANPEPKQSTGPEQPPRRIQLAALEDFNLIGLASFAALSFASLSALPAIAGIAIEATYLLVVPKTRWFEDRVDAKYERVAALKRESIKRTLYPQLSDEVRARFERLETARSQIRVEPGDQSRWYRAILRKLDYLMEKFLLFAIKDAQFRNYLVTVRQEASALGTGASAAAKPIRRAESRRQIESDGWAKSAVGEVQTAYDGESAAIDLMLVEDENLHNKAILLKRKDILLRRRIYVGRIGEILTNLSHQGRLIEDTFGLINDEIRARSPEQVIADIDDVIDSTDILTEALQKVAPFEELHIEA
jgi:hypothetical protein